MGRHVIADQRKDLHYDVFGDADDVAAGDLGHRNTVVCGGGEVKVV